MARPKEIEKAVRLSVVLSAAQSRQIEQAAIRQSQIEGKRLTTSEMIRRSIQRCYPPPEQFDFFGDKNDFSQHVGN